MQNNNKQDQASHRGKVRLLQSCLSFFKLKPKKRLLTALLALTIAITTVTSLAAPVFALTYKSSDITTRVSSYESGLILRQCLAGKNILASSDNIKDENYILEGVNAARVVSWDPKVVSYHPSLSEDNEMVCSEGKGLVRGALKRLGIDVTAFLCELGAKRNEGQDCINGSGILSKQNITQADIDRAVKKFTGLDINNPGNEVRYIRSKNILESGCFGEPTTLAIYNKEPQGKRWSIQTYDSGKKYYKAKSAHNEKPRGANGSEKGSVNCIVYWERANQYLSDYTRYQDALSIEDKERDERGASDAQTPPGGDENTTSCDIEGTGWIICPLVGTVSKVTDSLYGWISNFLLVQRLNLDTGSNENTMYIAWATMRNIANIAFVVVFLIIIFSQLTGGGFSNYGVKKLLPRLIVSAILVNISYWVAALAVDISNIIGNNIYNLLHSSTGLGSITLELSVWEDIFVWLLAGGAATGVTLGAITVIGAGAAFAPVLLWGGLAVLLAAVLSLLVAFFVLALRQALIIILIVLSPLAFVAFLLPNTEKYFTLWRKSLTTLLIFYPLFAVLFGGSYVAGMIIIGSAGDAEGDAAVGLLPILGLAVMAVPLALTPLIIRFSSGLMGKVAGMVNNKNRGLIDRARKTRDRKAGLAMHETLGRNKSAKNPFGGIYRRVQNSAMSDAARKGNIDTRNKVDYLNSGAASVLSQEGAVATSQVKLAEESINEGYANAIIADPTLAARAGGGTDAGAARVRASASAVIAEAETKAIKAEESSMSDMTVKNLKLERDNGSNSKERRAAAAAMIIKTGGDPDVHETINHMNSLGDDDASKMMRQHAASSMGARKPASMGAGAMGALGRGEKTGTFEENMDSRIKAGKFSAEGLASTSADELKEMVSSIDRIKAEGSVPPELNALQVDIDNYINNPLTKNPPQEVLTAMQNIQIRIKD